MSTATSSSRECPRCTQPIPGWSPVHLRCFVYRIRYVLAPFVLAGCAVLAQMVVIPTLQHEYGRAQQWLIARRQAAAAEAAKRLAKANETGQPARWWGTGTSRTPADLAPTGPRPTDYALRFFAGDSLVCTLPAGTRVDYRLFNGSDTLQFGTATLPEGACPQVKVRRFRIVTGEQVRKGLEEPRARAGTFVLTQTTRAFTYGRGPDQCVIPGNTQVMLVKALIPAHPLGTDFRQVYLPDGVCPRVNGDTVAIRWDALALATARSPGAVPAPEPVPPQPSGTVADNQPTDEPPRHPVTPLPDAPSGLPVYPKYMHAPKEYEAIRNFVLRSPGIATHAVVGFHTGHPTCPEIKPNDPVLLKAFILGDDNEYFALIGYPADLCKGALKNVVASIFESVTPIHHNSPAPQAPDTPPRQSQVPLVDEPTPAQRRQAALATIEGEVTDLSPQGWPVINGHVLRLHGISTVAPGQMGSFSKWLRDSGNYLECEPRPGGAVYQCFTRGRRDLAEIMLLNGIATAGGTAEDNYRNAMLSAMQARRGQWGQSNSEATP
jgi:hypothetical protein